MKTNILILLVLLGIASFTGSDKACAQATAIAPQTCDTQVWQTMAARARLETEREIMQNQNLIFKADSILTYTCFDSMAAHASKNVGTLFTHTTYFNGGQEIIDSTGPNSMDNAIQKAVIDSMTAYMSANFSHTFMGGRGTPLGLTASTDTSVPQSIENSGGTYSCSRMNRVWSVAKCMNYIHATEFSTTDGFYPFKNLTALSGGQNIDGYEAYKDTRDFPSECANSKPIYESSWEDMYNLSKNSPPNGGSYDALYDFGQVNNDVFKKVRDRVEPATCSNIKPIKTGVKVILSPGENASPYDDGICTNPGCTFQKDNAGGKCVAAVATP